VSAGREVRVEKLAPTGEGVVRGPEGVGFVEGALAGELVATTVYEVRKRFWRGRVRAVLEPSPDRVRGTHAGCAGCDWAHFDEAAARTAKRALFLETMRRIGKLEPEPFGELPIAPSATGYRMRVRLHAEDGRVGYHAPGTHRVAPAGDCEALAPATRALLPAIEDAIRAASAPVSEVAILEDRSGERRLVRATASGDARSAAVLGERLAASFQGVRVLGDDGAVLLRRGDPSLDVEVGGRPFSVSVDTFFQGNRSLVSALFEAVAAEGRSAPAGDALDAFGGAGLFAGALLDGGHRVVSVEADPGAVGDALRTRERWKDGGRWEIAGAPASRLLEEDDRRFDLVVADPPRAGLGAELASTLARRAKSRFVYVSCDPATLARDLPAILAQGFVIRSARLFDLFAFTHRVEALVALERAA
jgi:tRNA/tmRNA/rRNA uracil-C5-methylase (TrmA/RlmC/RlmD family)